MKSNNIIDKVIITLGYIVSFGLIAFAITHILTAAAACLLLIVTGCFGILVSTAGLLEK
jgi:hypothetical protein